MHAAGLNYRNHRELITWASLGLMRVGPGGRSAPAMQAPGPESWDGASVRPGYKINYFVASYRGYSPYIYIYDSWDGDIYRNVIVNHLVRSYYNLVN